MLKRWEHITLHLIGLPGQLHGCCHWSCHRTAASGKGKPEAGRAAGLCDVGLVPGGRAPAWDCSVPPTPAPRGAGRDLYSCIFHVSHYFYCKTELCQTQSRVCAQAPSRAKHNGESAHGRFAKGRSLSGQRAGVAAGGTGTAWLRAQGMFWAFCPDSH